MRKRFHVERMGIVERGDGIRGVCFGGDLKEGGHIKDGQRSEWGSLVLGVRIC